MKKNIQKKKGLFIVGFLLIAVVLSVPAYAWLWTSDDKAADIDAVELNWDDLVPEDYIPPPNPLDMMSQVDIDILFDGSPDSNKRLKDIEMSMAYAPTVPELNGKEVKIPGFVVPLDFDGQTELTEFLLVPYFGACIHTPPPPSNQVIWVTSDSSITFDDIYTPVWITGTMKTETIKTELAESGYRLQVKAVEVYTDPNAQ